MTNSSISELKRRAEIPVAKQRGRAYVKSGPAVLDDHRWAQLPVDSLQPGPERSSAGMIPRSDFPRKSTRRLIKSRLAFTSSAIAIIIGFALLYPLFAQSLPDDPIDVLCKKQDVFGRKIQLCKAGLLLIFFDYDNYVHRQSVFYAQSLYATFRSEQLEIVAVGKENSSLEDLKDFYQKGGLEFLLVRDQANDIQGAFRVKDCCGGVIFIDHGRIKHTFSNMLSPENLRQLIEKEMTGKINYSQRSLGQSPFMVDRPVPHIELSLPNSNQYISLDNYGEDYLVVTFFSSLCSMCNTGKRVESLMALKESQKLKERNINFILILMSPLNDRDVAEWRKVMALPFDICFSNFLFPDSVRYLTDPDVQMDPLTIVLNRQRKVIFSEEARVGESEFILKIEQDLLREAK